MPASGLYDQAVPLPTAREMDARPYGGDTIDHDAEQACGIVLAGSPPWDDGLFAGLRSPVLPLAHLPLIRYPLEWLRAGGIRNIIICAGGNTAAVRARFGTGASIGLALDYVEDEGPRGPAGSARDAARRSRASTFVVVEGSTIPVFDLRGLLATHQRSRGAATVVVEIERRRRSGYDGMGPVAGGAYVFSRRVLDGVSAHGYHDIKQGLLERLYAGGEQVAVHEVQGISPRIIDYPSYTAATSWLISHHMRAPIAVSDYMRVSDSRCHPSAFIHEEARLVGPVLVGGGARVEAGAVVIGPSSIGARSVIGVNATVSRAIIWNDCVVGKHAIVDASLLTDQVTVASRRQLFHAIVRGDAPMAMPTSASHSVPAARVRPRFMPPAQLPRGFAFPFTGGPAQTPQSLDEAGVR